MKKKKNILGYRGETDRSYGLAGMAIQLASFDALDSVAYISLDNAGPMVEFTGEYYYGGSPSVSPKATWHRLMENFRLTSALAIGNVMARCIVHEKGADPMDMLTELLKTIREEGTQVCQLEEEEVDRFFASLMNRANNLFHNPRLHPVIDSLASMLRDRRKLSGRSLAEEMHYLRII